MVMGLDLLDLQGEETIWVVHFKEAKSILQVCKYVHMVC